MSRKRKSTGKRSPHNRSLPRTQVGHPAAARVQVPAFPKSSNAPSELPARACALQGTGRVRAPVTHERPPIVPGATDNDAPAQGAPGVYGVGATYWLDGVSLMSPPPCGSWVQASTATVAASASSVWSPSQNCRPVSVAPA